MRLLLNALRPTLNGLELWIQQGGLDDHQDELMLCKGDAPPSCMPFAATYPLAHKGETDRLCRSHRSVPAGGEECEVDSPDFWGSACYLRRDQYGSLLCPDFLQGAAEGILAAGKASLLLQAKQQCASRHLPLCARES